MQRPMAGRRCSRAAVLLAGARLGRGRAHVGVERARVLGDGAARRRPTGRRAGSSRPCRRTSRRPRPSPCCARVRGSAGRIERARAYVTSHGLYELHLNGRRVGDELFTPGWTSYNKRLQYQTYDVTALLQSGRQRGRRHCSATAGIAATWLAGRPQPLRRPAGAAAADRDHLQGRAARESSAPTQNWKAATGPILMSGDLPRRDLRRAAREAGLEPRRLRRRATGRASRSPITARTPRRARRPAGAADRGAQAGQDLQDPGRRHGRSTWARTWSAGCG